MMSKLRKLFFPPEQLFILFLVFAFFSEAFCFAKDPEKNLQDLCAQKDDPLKSVAFHPSNPPTTRGKLAQENERLEDSDPDLGKAEFEGYLCKDVKNLPTSPEKDACEATFRKIFQAMRNTKITLKKTLADICQEIPQIPAKCANGQSDSQSCAKAIYKKLGEQLSSALGETRGYVGQLLNRQRAHLGFMKAQVKNVNPQPTAASVKKYVELAGAKNPNKASDLITECGNALPSGASSQTPPHGGIFCQHSNAGYQAGYISYHLENLTQKMEPLSQRFNQLSGESNNRLSRGGDITGKNGTGGIGLKDLVPLATLGMMGAGMYCQLSKNCGNSDKKDQASEISIPNQASSMEPQAGEQRVSPVAENNRSASSSPSGFEAKPPNEAGSSNRAIPSYGGGSHGLGEPSLAPFSGNLDSGRGLASTSSSSGPVGASGGGSLAAGSTNSSERGTNAENSPHSQESGTGSFGGGGFSGSGGSSSSGFSLGEGHNASSADTALKNILNGDSPVGGDPSLAALSEGGGDAKGDSNLLSLDPDNIFARVKSTHHRCQKRGWVGEKSSGSI